MSTFNLYAWRQQQRQQQQRRLLIEIVISVITMLLLFFAVEIYEYYAMADKQQQKTQLQQKLEQLDQQTNKLAAIKQQMQQQTLAPRLLMALSNAIPKGMYLTNLQQQQTLLILRGYAQSNTLIQQFIKNLNQLTLLRQVQLKKSLRTDVTAIENFSIEFIIEAKLA